MKTRWQPLRDILLFVVGIVGIANEAIFKSGERPTLLLLYAAMIGLPVFLRSDERDQEHQGPDSLERNGNGGSKWKDS